MIRANAASYKEIYSIDIDKAIEGLTANSTTKQIFSSKNPSATTQAFTRRTTCWAKNIDTSPQSIWNDNASGPAPYQPGGYGGSGTLISPRHVIYANHFRFYNGTKLVFVDMNNNCYIRTITSSAQVGSTDIQIGLLDSDITTISFAKILDISIDNITNISYKFPVFFMNQNRNALVGEYYSNGAYSVVVYPTDSTQRALFYEDPIAGDSGNVICLIFNNKIILTSAFFYQSQGPNYSNYINDINSTMTSLGGGYTATLFTINDITPTYKIGKGILNNQGGNLGKIIFS